MASQNHLVTVTATSKTELVREIDVAIDRIREVAVTGNRKGILVMHEAPGRSSVALSADVPFGLTQERLAW